MSGKDIDDMTFEKIKFWTVLSLKDFLGGKEFCCFPDEDSKLHGGQILFFHFGRSNDIFKYTCRGIVYGIRHSLQQNTSEQ